MSEQASHLTSINASQSVLDDPAAKLATRKAQLRQARIEFENVLDDPNITTENSRTPRINALDNRIRRLTTLVELLERELGIYPVTPTTEVSAQDNGAQPTIVGLNQPVARVPDSFSQVKVPSNLPSYGRKLPTDMEVVDDFLDQLENDLNSALIPQHPWRRILIARISVNKADWIKDHSGENTPWSEVRNMLIKHVKSSAYQAIQRRAFESIHPDPKEDMSAFTERYRRQMRLADRNDNVNVRYHFIDRLPDWLQEKLENANHSAELSDLDTLFATAVKFEQTTKQRKQKYRAGEPSPTSRSKPRDRKGPSCPYCAAKGNSGR